MPDDARPADVEPTLGNDFTKVFDYERLLAEEEEHYSQIEVTADLKEDGVHAISCWRCYWERVARVIEAGAFNDLPGWGSRSPTSTS